MQLDNESWICLAILIIIPFCAVAFDFTLGCVILGLYALTWILLHVHHYLQANNLLVNE